MPRVDKYRALVCMAAALGGVTAARAADSFVVGQGPMDTNLNRVRVFLADGTPDPTDFQAYAIFHWGVNVAAGDVDPGGLDEIVTGAPPAFQLGPHVRAFKRAGTPINKVSFFAYGTLRGGANVAVGRVDAADEIVTGPGPYRVFGPHVRGFHYDGQNLIQIITQINFHAYPGLRHGVNVGVGSIDADSFDEILTGAGPGPTYGTHVKGWNYDGVAVGPVPGCSFFAFPNTGGVKVAGGDVNADADDEIVAASAGQVAAFDYLDETVSALPGCTASGEGIGTGDVSGVAGGNIMVGDATSSLVRALDYDGTSTNVVVSFTAFGSSAKVTLAGAAFGM